MENVNLVAVLLCGVASLVLGAVWYAPQVFGKAWQAGTGLTDAQLQSGNMPLIFGGAFVLSLIAAYVFAMFLGRGAELGFAVGVGFSAGLCWVAASYGINYLFERRSLKHWLINGSYHTVQFTLFGLIISLLK